VSDLATYLLSALGDGVGTTKCCLCGGSGAFCARAHWVIQRTLLWLSLLITFCMALIQTLLEKLVNTNRPLPSPTTLSLRRWKNWARLSRRLNMPLLNTYHRIMPHLSAFCQ